jgi:hypothetical protein
MCILQYLRLNMNELYHQNRLLMIYIVMYYFIVFTIIYFNVFIFYSLRYYINLCHYELYFF